jgi:transposase
VRPWAFSPRASTRGAEAMVAYLKLLIAKMKRERFGQSAERGRKLDQLELQLEELEAGATEDEVAVGTAEPDPTTVHRFTRKKPVRGPLPAHLPRERVVVPAPRSCPCCGGRLVKLGEDVTETLEVVPRQWKVIQTVREKFTCRSCEKITQPLAPFHVIARARAGARLLAMILYAKFGEHQPLNRQSETYAREGIELDVSTLPDWVGACAASLAPLIELIRRHVLTAERLHGRRHDRAGAGQRQDCHWPGMGLCQGRSAVRRPRPARSAVLLLAQPQWRAPQPASRRLCRDPPGRCWRLSSGRPRAGPGGRFGDLYDARRRPGPITEAACWSHGRRKFFVLADFGKSPLAVEAVRRIDEVFAIEREINGIAAEQRLAVREERIRPLIGELEGWMRTERARLSRHADIAKAMDYMLKRWPVFTRVLDDGRICLSNNAAERALRGIALGRRAWLFAGSDRGGERAAAMYTLIATAKLNGVDPQAWLADVLRRIADHPASRLHELLPWNWKLSQIPAAA